MMGLRKIGNLLLTGVPGWFGDRFLTLLQKESLDGLQNLRCFQGDLRDDAEVKQNVNGIDTILHAAGVIHVRHPSEWDEINTKGTERLLKAAIRTGVTRFIYISSNAAAGRSQGKLPVDEEMTPNPLSPYGLSKWRAEQILNAHTSEIEVVILRPCMFYGPPVPSRHIQVYRQVLKGTLPLVGSGDFARSLSFIDDVVEASRLAMVHEAAKGQTYFVADTAAYTTRSIIETMAEVLRVPPRFISLPKIVGPLCYQLDQLLNWSGIYSQSIHLAGESCWNVAVCPRKIMDELGFLPKGNFKAGLEQTIEWCRAQGLIPPHLI